MVQAPNRWGLLGEGGVYGKIEGEGEQRFGDLVP